MFPDSYLSDPAAFYDLGWNGIYIWLIMANVFSSLWLIIFAQDTDSSMILQVVAIFAYLFSLMVSLLISRKLTSSLKPEQET